MKNTTGIPQEHKTFNSYLLKADEQQGIVESIVAVMGNVDQGDDIIHPGAFLKTMTEHMGKIRVLDQHQTDSILRVLGRPIAMRELSRDQLPPDLLAKYPTATGGLYTKTQYNLQTDNGRNAFNLISAGDVSEYSIGYDPVDTDISHDVIDGKQHTVRNLRAIRLYEYSPVIWGMNSATSTLSAKGATGAAGLPLADRARAWDSTAAQARVRSWAGATDAPNEKYRSAFFWYDAEAPDNFTSYKLQFADVIDGKLTAIPRGIFAVAAVLQGSRGGVNIPAGDKDAIKSKVNAYYAKMRKEFDDDSIVAPWESNKMEGKPWNVFHEGGKWEVYKLDADGKPTGKPLGTFDTEEEARAQVRALYANENKPKQAQLFGEALASLANEQSMDDAKMQLHKALCESLESIGEDGTLDATAKLLAANETLAQYNNAMLSWFTRALSSGMYEQEVETPMPEASTPEAPEMPSMQGMSATQAFEIKAGRILAARNETRLRDALKVITEVLAELDKTDEAPAKRAATLDAPAQAGPTETTSPTNETLLASIEIELEELKLLEV